MAFITSIATSSGFIIPSKAETSFSRPLVIAVSTACGHKIDTPIPCFPYVIASHSARPMAACFVVEYVIESI